MEQEQEQEQCMTNRYFTPILGIMPIFGVAAAAVPNALFLSTEWNKFQGLHLQNNQKSLATLRRAGWFRFWAGFNPRVHVLQFFRLGL